jgi:hypothetical protein
MSEHLAETLDLMAGWQRVRKDIQIQREFVRHPYEISLVELDLDGWLLELRRKVRPGFHPFAAPIADVPKGYGAVRPGALLKLDDRVIYAACIGTVFPAIFSALEWSQGVVDFSYQLTSNPNNADWFRSSFTCWNAFREKTLQKIRNGASTIVVTDITAYYENIDIGILVSDLRQIGIDREIVNLLSVCLNRWAICNGRGIPQGMSASDVLGKVYLNNVDSVLRESGFDHLRYVDDVRIFCRNDTEAKKALLLLTQLLRRRGLNLQSAKTEVLQSQDAKERFETVIPTIKRVKDEFIRKLIEDTGYTGAYLTLAEADELASENPDEASADILRNAFDQHFGIVGAKFNNTLFRFIVNRLGKQKDRHCFNYCLSALVDHPEETSYILDYFSRISRPEETLDNLYRFLTSGHAVYDYQTYLIFEWLNKIPCPLDQRILSEARRIAFDNSKPAYLRAVCRQQLGRNASAHDLERIETCYATSTEPLERAQILCDLKEMEVGRRNGFLIRSGADHPLCGRAVRLVRGGNA